MINNEKWINSLKTKITKSNHQEYQLDNKRWTDTISKKNIINPVKKYSLLTILFICGLLFVSVVKNETRILQKQINNLEASINTIKFNLDQASLDNEVITSPKNLSHLAKEHLDNNLKTYSRSQIIKFDKKTVLSEKVNLKVKENLPKKNTKFSKIKNIYSNPKTIPVIAKNEVIKKIKKNKESLQNILESPKDILSYKTGRWGVIQIAKALLGFPVVPGR
tara:strand:- start:374 stop:1036 length:663 start_codon:yes stop_codon:yes gene_type:complete